MDDFEKEFMGEAPAPQQPAGAAEDRQPAAASAAGMPDFESEFYGRVPTARPAVAPRPRPGIAPESAQPTAERPAAAVRPRTVRQMARTAPLTQEPVLTRSEALRMAAQNLPSSVMGQISSLGHAIVNPGETLQGLAAIGKGAVSKAAGAVGFDVDKTDQRVLDAILDQYKRTYFTSEQDFLRALAKDPAGILADASMLVTGGASAAARGAGAGSKAARVAALAQNLDPVQAALNVAGKVGTGIQKSGAFISSGATGVPREALELAAEIGKSGTPEQRLIYKRMKAGEVPHEEIINLAESALDKARKERSSQYQMQMGRLNPANVDFTEAGRALQQLRDDNTIRLSNGQTIPKNRAVLDVLDKIEREILLPIASEPVGSPARNVFGADAAKQSIGELRNSVVGSNQAHFAATKIYNSVKDAINRADPRYGNVMSEYERMSDFLNQAKMSLGVGRRISDDAILRRLTKGDNKQAQQLISQLGAYEPQLPAAIAGAATSDWMPSAMRQNLLYSLPIMSGAYTMNPLVGAAHFATQFAAGSPRVAGNIAYKMGRISGPLGRATEYKYVLPAQAAGVAREEMLSGVPLTEEEQAAQQKEQTPEYEPFYSSAQGEGERRGPAGNAVSQEVIDRILEKEGRGQNPEGSAYGPYQFVDDTWREQVRKHFPEVAQGMSDDELNALKKTPAGERIAMQLGPIFINENAQFLEQNGFPATPGNIYLAHFFGRTGAVRALEAARNNPNTPVVDIVGEQAVKQNRRVLEGKTVGDVIAWTDSQMQMASGGRIGRKSGGRVQSVDSLVDDLMRRAQKAKKEVNKMTEPLLNQPDETIAHALDVAQRAI